MKYNEKTFTAVLVTLIALLLGACGDDLEHEIVGVCSGVGAASLPEYEADDGEVSHIVLVFPGEHLTARGGQPSVGRLGLPDGWSQGIGAKFQVDRTQLVGCLYVRKRTENFDCEYEKPDSNQATTKVMALADFDMEVRSASDGALIRTEQFFDTGISDGDRSQVCGLVAAMDSVEERGDVYSSPDPDEVFSALRDLVEG